MKKIITRFFAIILRKKCINYFFVKLTIISIQPPSRASSISLGYKLNTEYLESKSRTKKTRTTKK